MSKKNQPIEKSEQQNEEEAYQSSRSNREKRQKSEERDKDKGDINPGQMEQVMQQKVVQGSQQNMGQMTQLMRQQAEFRINQIPLFGFPFSVPFQYNEFNRPFNLNNLPQNNQYFHQFKQFQPPAHQQPKPMQIPRGIESFQMQQIYQNIFRQQKFAISETEAIFEMCADQLIKLSKRNPRHMQKILNFAILKATGTEEKKNSGLYSSIGRTFQRILTKEISFRKTVTQCQNTIGSVFSKIMRIIFNRFLKKQAHSHILTRKGQRQDKLYDLLQLRKIKYGLGSAIKGRLDRRFIKKVPEKFL